MIQGQTSVNPTRDTKGSGCFVQPADIPIVFALAVHAVLHNTATWESWDIIDNEYGSPDDALVAIGRIYVTNGWPWTERETAWWSAELTKKAVRL